MFKRKNLVRVSVVGSTLLALLMGATVAFAMHQTSLLNQGLANGSCVPDNPNADIYDGSTYGFTCTGQIAKAMWINDQDGPPAQVFCVIHGSFDYYYDADFQANFWNEDYLNGVSIACPTSACNDGRVNTNCSAPEIVYCNGDSADFYAYNYDTLKGDFDFRIPLADLQQSVSVRTLIKQVGTTRVYLMPDGRVLLVARQTDGKDYFMFWNPADCASIQEGAEWGVK